MNLKSRLALICGKFAYWFLTTFTKGGSSLPGKIATYIDPDILKYLAKNYRVIVITGTNGKTLTTSLTTQVIESSFPSVLTNDTGSNMIQGIVGSFLLADPSLKGHLAVIEVDEGSLKHVLKDLNPEAIVYTNIFPDQMDRFPTLKHVQDLLFEGARTVPEATLIYNADDPYLNPMDLPNPTRTFGVTDQDYQATDPLLEDDTLCPQGLTYQSRTYADLGDYACENSAFQRPDIDDPITRIHHVDSESSTFDIRDQTLTLPLAGVYNIYNALAAYSVGKFLNIADEEILQVLSQANQVDGRQEVFEIQDKEIVLNLVKNPVGLNQVLDLLQLEERPYDFYFFLNDQYADGQDTQWIQSGNFHQLIKHKNLHDIYAGGRRYELVVKELHRQKVSQDIHSVTAVDQLGTLIENTPQKNIHILATYTAMVEIRDYLSTLT